MSKKEIEYVITAQPERPHSLYFDENGKQVNKSLAERFYSRADAKEFAEKHGIELDGVHYIIVVA